MLDILETFPFFVEKKNIFHFHFWPICTQAFLVMIYPGSTKSLCIIPWWKFVQGSKGWLFSIKWFLFASAFCP